MTNRVDHCGILAHKKHRFFSCFFFHIRFFSHLNDLHLEGPATYKGSSIYRSTQEYGQEDLYFIVIVSLRHSLLSKFQPENQWRANQDQF